MFGDNKRKVADLSEFNEGRIAITKCLIILILGMACLVGCAVLVNVYKNNVRETKGHFFAVRDKSIKEAIKSILSMVLPNTLLCIVGKVTDSYISGNRHT